MASTYVNDLRLNEMATGDASGSWGTVTNTNLELIGEAFSYGTETIGDADSTLTIADGAADAARSFYLKITSSVDLTTTRIVTLGPNTVSKVWMIENATTGSQVITIKQGSGATINVPNGQVKMISTDGAGSGGAVLDLLVDVDLTGTTTLVNLDVSGTLGVTGVLTATSLDISGDIDVDGTTNLDVVDIDGATQIDATVTVGVDDTGYDVKFFGATAGAYMLWDESADDLILGGAAGLSVNSAALVTGVLTTTAATVFNGGFAANVGSTITTADNTSQLTLISTDADANAAPTLDLYRNSASPADEDLVGQTRFVGRNDNSQDVNYAIIKTKMLDVSDGTEDGRFEIETISAGGGLNRLTIDPTELIINEGSADLDFRVESDTDANALFVQGSDGFVGIGTGSPTTKLQSKGGSISSPTDNAGLIANASASFVVNHGNDYGLYTGYVASANDAIGIAATRTGGTALPLSLQPFGGNVGIGTDAPVTPLHVKGANATYVRIESTSASQNAMLDIKSTVATWSIGQNAVKTDGSLEFYNGSSTPIFFTTGGAVTVGNGLTLTDGNLVVAAGHGIDFSATAGTGTSELLDDYEEGTFVPTLAYATAGTASFGYDAQTAHYVKVGDIVHFQLNVRLNAFTKGTGSGTPLVTGLPFTAYNTGGYASAGLSIRLYSWTFNDIPTAAVTDNATYATLTTMSSNSASIDISDPDSGSMIWLTGTYRTA
jgi:hypothetical protein